MRVLLERPRITPLIVMCLCVACGGVQLSAAPAWRTRPVTELTKGEAPFEDKNFNVGPTGFRGWVFHRGVDSSESRQILVNTVETNSPAYGVLEVGDVILGANGQGGQPRPFDSDARRNIAEAIQSAEARDPATLNVLRWRSGTTEAVTLTLQTMGTYARTAPYNCEKSRKILMQGAEAFYQANDPGEWNLGALFLLAVSDPSNPNADKYLAKAKEWVHELIVPASELNPLSSKVAWQHSYKLIILAEYYLKTRDQDVFQTLKDRALCYARNQSWYGTTGHQYATKRPDGGNNGPMAGYGAINGTGVAGFLGMVLAREAGVNHPDLDEAIRRSSTFFSSYAHKSGIPYGEHSYGDGKGMYDMNGKNATAALALMKIGDRKDAAKYFAKLTMASSEDRQAGHAGPFFNYMWPALGAAALGDTAAAYYFKQTSWLFDLERKWDGSVVFDSFGQSNKYGTFPAVLSHLLTYTLPLKQLYITGRGHDRSHWLTMAELREVAMAEHFDAESSSMKQLASALSNWAPQVRQAAAEELAKRIKDNEQGDQLLTRLHGIVANQESSPESRNAICQVLRHVADKRSAPVLADLLDDSNSYVRFGAANALRYLPRDAVMAQINKILKAEATTVAPAFPPMEGDPLQFAHYQMAQLLFYGGRAYGPRGVLSGDISGIDRALLWPAVVAVANTPTGHGRTVGTVYEQLTQEDVFALGETIVESVRIVAPADAMFAGGVRKNGAEVLEKYDIAEGVALCFALEDRMVRESIEILKGYGASALTVDPDPDILQHIYELWYVQGLEDLSGLVSNMLTATDVVPLTPLKKIDSVTADASVIALPDTSTDLAVQATNFARSSDKDSVYTWEKVYGAGEVRFSPNGTWDSKNTKVTFTGEKPGKYRFEVTMSDDLGYTVVRDTVDVTLLDKKKLFAKTAELPPNQPPVVQSLSVQASPGISVPVVLTATDPDGDDLAFVLKVPPQHGELSGKPPHLQYTADFGFTGQDQFVFNVIDGQGVSQTGKVSIRVVDTPVQLAVYEGFDYEPGELEGQTTRASIGLTGTWYNLNENYTITAGSLAYSALPSTGGKMQSPTWGRRPRATRAIDKAVLSRSGLLKHGGELWFSVVIGMQKKLNRTNGILFMGLYDGAKDGAADVGFKYARENLHAVINGVEGEGRAGLRRAGDITYAIDEPHLIVGHCQWGKTDAEPDTVTIYRVLDIPTKGPVLLEEPISVYSAPVSQQDLDSLYFDYGEYFYLDEIRVGPTYESVLLGTRSMSAQ